MGANGPRCKAVRDAPIAQLIKGRLSDAGGLRFESQAGRVTTYRFLRVKRRKHCNVRQSDESIGYCTPASFQSKSMWSEHSAHRHQHNMCTSTSTSTTNNNSDIYIYIYIYTTTITHIRIYCVVCFGAQQALTTQEHIMWCLTPISPVSQVIPSQVLRWPSLYYTRSPSQDFRLFGPRPWKILATTYEQKDSWATQTLAKILWAGILLWRPGVSVCFLLFARVRARAIRERQHAKAVRLMRSNSNARNVIPSQRLSSKRNCLITSARDSLWETPRSSERLSFALAPINASVKRGARFANASMCAESIDFWFVKETANPETSDGAIEL